MPLCSKIQKILINLIFFIIILDPSMEIHSFAHFQTFLSKYTNIPNYFYFSPNVPFLNLQNVTCFWHMCQKSPGKCVIFLTIVSKIKIEVFELEKQNKEKMILIEDLSFKMENTNAEEDCSNCKETNQLTTNFNNLRSKYDDLLKEN